MRLVERWLSSAALLVAGIVMLVGDVGTFEVVAAIILVVLAVSLSPLAFPRSHPDAEGRALAAERGAPLVYWRPGCSYCFRMRMVLGPAGRRAVWVDVSRDPDASARVKAYNDGNETVPTVVVGEEVRTNPGPSWVRGHLPVA